MASKQETRIVAIIVNPVNPPSYNGDLFACREHRLPPYLAGSFSSNCSTIQPAVSLFYNTHILIETKNIVSAIIMNELQLRHLSGIPATNADYKIRFPNIDTRTISRALRLLKEKEWIKKENNKWILTENGEIKIIKSYVNLSNSYRRKVWMCSKLTHSESIIMGQIVYKQGRMKEEYTLISTGEIEKMLLGYYSNKQIKRAKKALHEKGCILKTKVSNTKTSSYIITCPYHQTEKEV